MQVKILYVRNLMLSTTEEHLEEVFTKAAEPVVAGKKPVERVKKLKDYAFIHFSEREEALRALHAINGTYTSFCPIPIHTRKVSQALACSRML